MKRCSYCGKEFDDDVAICPVDGQSTVPDQRNRIVPTRPSFSANIVSPISFTGMYCIFAERDSLIFIQVEGAIRSVLEVLTLAFGHWGSLIRPALRFATKDKLKAKLQELDASDLEDLLRKSSKNFKLHLSEIRDVIIEAPRFFATGRKCQLMFFMRQREEITCEFENNGEIDRAIQLLVPIMDSTLKVNVEWNGQAQRFERKKGLAH